MPTFASRRAQTPILLLATLLAAGCSSSDAEDGTPATMSLTASPADGPADTHCSSDAGPIANRTDMAACTADADEDEHDHDADAAPPAHHHGVVSFGTEGNDDDCKYRVTYAVAPAGGPSQVNFDVTLETTVDDEPAPGATPHAEVFLDETHPAPNSGASFTETEPGRYTIGPIQFDAPGRWTVRFHFFGSCSGAELSPHGHAAFYVDVK